MYNSISYMLYTYIQYCGEVWTIYIGFDDDSAKDSDGGYLIRNELIVAANELSRCVIGLKLEEICCTLLYCWSLPISRRKR